MSVLEHQRSDALPGVGGLPAGNDRPSSADPVVPDEFAVRVRAWWLEATSHPFWKDFVEQGDEDMAFYVGGKGQWGIRGSYKDYEKLLDQKRAVVSINHIGAVVDVLSGYERANRMDLKAQPQGDADVNDAQLMSLFLKYAQDQTNAPDVLSDMFEDGNIRGMDVAEIGVDYTGDRPVNGEIVVSRRTPGFGPGKDIIWDPYFTKYDLSDARYVLHYKWAFLLDLIAEYPDHEAELREAVGRLKDILRESKTAARHGGDNYGSVKNHPVEHLEQEAQFYHEPDDRLLIVEAWYHVYYTKYAVFDKTTGKVTEVKDTATATEMKKSDPENLRIHRNHTRGGDGR